MLMRGRRCMLSRFSRLVYQRQYIRRQRYFLLQNGYGCFVLKIVLCRKIELYFVVGLLDTQRIYTYSRVCTSIPEFQTRSLLTLTDLNKIAWLLSVYL